MEKNLYEVACDCSNCIGPHKIWVTVEASDKHSALDAATDHDDVKELYDEEIQRDQADGKEYSSYDLYVREIDYVEGQ